MEGILFKGRGWGCPSVLTQGQFSFFPPLLQMGWGSWQRHGRIIWSRACTRGGQPSTSGHFRRAIWITKWSLWTKGTFKGQPLTAGKLYTTAQALLKSHLQRRREDGRAGGPTWLSLDWAQTGSYAPLLNRPSYPPVICGFREREEQRRGVDRSSSRVTSPSPAKAANQLGRSNLGSLTHDGDNDLCQDLRIWSISQRGGDLVV